MGVVLEARPQELLAHLQAGWHARVRARMGSLAVGSAMLLMRMFHARTTLPVRLQVSCSHAGAGLTASGRVKIKR